MSNKDLNDLELQKNNNAEFRDEDFDDFEEDVEHDESLIKQVQEVKNDLKEEEEKKSEDDDGRSIKKGEEQQEESTEKENLDKAFSNLVSDVNDAAIELSEFLSKKNQQRNLVRENGGLESEEQKEVSAKDSWDDRSEEIDKMGDYDISEDKAANMVQWAAKKNRLKSKKSAKDAAKAGMEGGGVAIGLAALAPNEKKMTMVEKLKIKAETQVQAKDIWR
jgi:hypothetical protein